MAQVAIIYFSGTGHNHLLAEAVKSGVKAVAGATPIMLRITGEQIQNGRWSDTAYAEKLQAADGIIFGAPTYMAGPAAQFKAFADWSGEVWFRHGWKNKVAGGFTHSGTPSGDKVVTLQYFMAFAAQHGMIWVTNGELPSFYFGKTDGMNRLGGFMGSMGAGGAPQGQPAKIDDGDRLTGHTYGKRVAELTLKLSAA